MFGQSSTRGLGDRNSRLRRAHRLLLAATATVAAAALTPLTGALGSPQVVGAGARATDAGQGINQFAVDVSEGTGATLLFAGSAASFAQARNYETGAEPVSVAIGDLNGDGKLDLATANDNADGTVSVLVNRGDGSFRAKRDFRTGGGPFSVAIGDLNGDGKPDLATANFVEDGAVSVLLNRGDGNFQPKRDYATGGANSVAIADLDGDGKPDLATANSGANSVSVLLNRGDGTFEARRDYATGPVPEAVAIGDLNGDGKPDLATANYYANSVSVLLNRGDGSFEARLGYATGNAPWSVAIGDLNGDGKPDLATANPDAYRISELLNTPGLCTVQNVRGTTVRAAKRTVARANCRVGKIRRAYSKSVKRGRVISQKPTFGAVLQGGGKVNLVVSRGRPS
jgi:hypothetical protein